MPTSLNKKTTLSWLSHGRPRMQLQIFQEILTSSMASYMIYLLTAGLLVLIFWNPKDNLKQITTNQETQANLTKDSEQKRNKDENQQRELFYNNALKKYDDHSKSGIIKWMIKAIVQRNYNAIGFWSKLNISSILQAHNVGICCLFARSCG
jgi:hypothetical protein